MPSELLHFPPSYTLVGIYRLLTDPFIRSPVLDKVKHASLRGLVVAGAYAWLSWRPLSWLVATYLIGRGGFGGSAGGKRVAGAVRESVGGKVWVGVGTVGREVDLVLYTHLLILVPQISSILRFFIYKNLRLARSRAYALTVSSRGKPPAFWAQGYIEEWADPPKPSSGDAIGQGARRRHEAKWISWILWWPVQLVLRHYILVPLSPSLPLFAPIFTSVLRSLTTAEYLHQPYFEIKGMNPDEIWTWVEERAWAYRAFGFVASWLESVPIIGLFLSISNRVGAAMWAFDLEKRQHLFANGIIPPLPRDKVGFYGMGSADELELDIQGAEEEIDRKWSRKQVSGGAGEISGSWGVEGEKEL